MTAKDAIVRRKTLLQDILCSNRTFIFEKVQEGKLITDRDHRNLTNILNATPEDQIYRLVDTILGKGEKTCKAFLNMLQTDEDIKATYTRLEEIQWDDNAGGPVHNKGQEAVCDVQYELTSKPTGLCLIMNNEIFPGSQPRAGTNQDAVDLARTFSKLGFRVLMFKDQTKIQMEETLKLLSSLKNPTELWNYGDVFEWSRAQEFTKFNVDDPPQHGDAFVCCVMSHGDKGRVSGTDGEFLSIDYIKTTFNGENCPLLDEKPKVFFIQACQTERRSQPGGQADDSAEGDATPSTPSGMVVKVESDFLFAMATVENYPATRHPINGSWFMQGLCKQLQELCPSGVDLLTILCRVHNEVSERGGKQMPETKLTLRKKLVFKTISN